MLHKTTLRRVLAALLCAVLLTVPALAADLMPYADSLHSLGVFFGTDAGYELDRAPTRAEAAAMLIRLLGAEDEAQAMSSHDLPFTDVPDWAAGYVAYAYENGLTAGVSADKFGASTSVTAQMYLTFMLRALGYSDANGDFTYANAVSFAQSVGLLDESTASALATTTFTRGWAAALSYQALRLPVKGSDALLAERLGAEGRLDENAVSRFLETVIADNSGTAQTGASANDGTLTVAEVAACKRSVVLLSVSGASGSGQGSGVILSADGLILTNYHVIDGMTSLTVTFDDGSTYAGAVYVEDADEALDLALLSIDKTGLTPIERGDSDTLYAGQQIVAIGSPYGLMNTVSEGIVSSVRESELQITAAISSGSSGGALLDMSGELVGVTYAGIAEGQNLGFAIPINKLDELTARTHTPLADYTAAARKAGAPQNLRLVKREDDTVYLQWDAVSNASYYHVYYRAGNAPSYTPVTSFGRMAAFTRGDSYSAALSGLRSGVSYSFVVTAVTNSGESAASEALTVTL